MIIIPIAENQRPVAAEFGRLGAAINFGDRPSWNEDQLAVAIRHVLESPERRQAMSDRAAQLVDGLGARRVVERMLCGSLNVRSVRADDAWLLFTWQQDPAVRHASFTLGPAAWSDHCAWLAQRQSDSNSAILICETSSGWPLGCVRLQRLGSRATIGFVLSPEFRGRGIGPMVLRAGIARFLARNPETSIDALIKPENIASKRTFAKAGFRFAALESVRDQPAERWIRPATDPFGEHRAHSHLNFSPGGPIPRSAINEQLSPTPSSFGECR
jgi:RimJ/RimL family protein N-acetyltransferase